jgi:hypothetical protein
LTQINAHDHKNAHNLFPIPIHLQGPEVLRHDEPPLQPPGRIPRHGIPVGHQHQRLVEHLLRRLPPFPVLHPPHDRHGDAHPAAAALRLVRVVEVLGRAELERRVDDVRVQRLDLVRRCPPLRLEELVVVCRRGYWGAVDGDVGGDVVARGRVDVEGREVCLLVDRGVVERGKSFGSCIMFQFECCVVVCERKNLCLLL